uniref:Proline rich transmembrane protein 4b n=1 Tax=Hippocampus comes TaxID=109280 RepID=A0A3Q2YWT8_HIPCM
MLRLHRTLALCFWCLLLVRKQTSADEEGLWGPTPSREKPPQKKYGSYWWTPSLPKLPSFPSLPFRLPFYPAGGQSETTELNATGRELSDPTDQSASGDGITTEASSLPTGSTQFLSGATEIRTESLPAGTSHPPHGSADNGALVATSATHIGNTPSPTSSGMPEQNGTRRHPPRDTTLALTAQDDDEFLHTMSTTTAPEITVHPDETSTIPGTGITFHPTPPDTTAEKTQNSNRTSDLTSGTDTLLPDCNKGPTGACNFSGDLSSDMKPQQNITGTNQSSGPSAFSSPLMLVPLYTDWNSAMAAWGLAWEAHVYGAGCVFAMLTLACALNLLCLPLRCPSGCGYFALVSLFLLAAGGTRSFSLLYDAYGHQERLPSAEASLMLYEAPFPCLTAAFGLVFLLLSMRSRMQLSYSAFQRPCFLACLVTLHFAATFGPGTLLKFYQRKPPLCLFLSLISRGAFVALATFLSTAYFVFYVYVRADSKHIYHLNNTSPTPAERFNRCPFAESRDWDRAAVTVCLSALFCLACAGLQLYAMLNAAGVTGGEEVFRPWCWWAFQFSCRLCELGVCLTLVLVVAQPVYCSNQLPSAGSCWTELLASKAPILPGNCQWSLGQHEKLAIVDRAGLGCGQPSGGSSFASDSTTDLRPPSPINLRRSIDEALFSEALFPMSLFNTTTPTESRDLIINNHCAIPSLCDPRTDDPGLYRTSSCADITLKAGEIIVGGPPSPSLSSSSCSSPERWRGSSSSSSQYQASIGDSSLVICPSPEAQAQQQSDPQRQYQTLGGNSQESLDLDMSSEADRSVQEEFMSVCRQIDAVSICSETIDL